jgi:hypothetical protein
MVLAQYAMDDVARRLAEDGVSDRASRFAYAI